MAFIQKLICSNKRNCLDDFGIFFSSPWWHDLRQIREKKPNDKGVSTNGRQLAGNSPNSYCMLVLELLRCYACLRMHAPCMWQLICTSHHYDAELCLFWEFRYCSEHCRFSQFIGLDNFSNDLQQDSFVLRCTYQLKSLRLGNITSYHTRLLGFQHFLLPSRKALCKCY